MKKQVSSKIRESSIVLLPDGPFDLKEAYRTLRTNLQFLSVSSKLKTIVLTSTQPMEGKTTASINLAIALAMADFKVILFDTDVRRPRAHKYIKTSAVPGLTNCLVNDMDLEDIIRRTEYGFDFVPSGSTPPNPSELLSSERMKRIIRQAEKEYDYVLFDTPPIGLVTDAAVLSQSVDGVIFVMRYATTNIDAAKVAKESLERVGARIVGGIISDVELEGYKRSKYSNYGEKYGEYVQSSNRASSRARKQTPG